MIRKLIVSFMLCVSYCLPAVCQTGIGSLTHIANAEGVGVTDSFLKGDWAIDNVIGDNLPANRRVSKALDMSGFKDATISFRDGAAFAIQGSGKIIPGTWKEPEDGYVRIGFSKIFTYGMTGQVKRDGESCQLVFDARDFLGFVQRTLAIIGREDTRALVDFVSENNPRELGFEIRRRPSMQPSQAAPDNGAASECPEIASSAINKAIEAVSREGGGEVRIPAGTYYCYSIRLASNVTLRLVEGAKIVAARPVDGQGYDLPEKAINTQYQGFGHNHVCNSLIWGIGLENVTICGEGMIDGSCLDSWTSCIITGTPGHYVEDVELKDINLQFQGGFKAKDGGIVPPEFVKDYPEPWMFGTIPAKGFFIRHARNITLQNVAFNYLKKDFRPLFVRTDADNIKFNNITVNGEKY